MRAAVSSNPLEWYCCSIELSTFFGIPPSSRLTLGAMSLARPPMPDTGAFLSAQRHNKGKDDLSRYSQDFLSCPFGTRRFNFLEPVDDGDELRRVAARTFLDHQEALAIVGDVVGACP